MVELVMATQTPTSVLFYPHIEPRDGAWLKSALLLWDHVYRIVPSGYVLHDTDDAKAAVASDLLRSVALEQNDLRGFAEEFLVFLRSLPCIPAGLTGDFDRLHPDKIDSKLYPYLETVAARIDETGWLHLNRGVARGYMFFLSRRVAERRNLSLATDDGYAWAIGSWFDERGSFAELSYDAEADGFYAALMLENVVPANIENVPMADVIGFAEKRREEKEALRTKLVELKAALFACESPTHARQIVADHSESLAMAQDRFRRSMGFCNTEVSGALLAFGLPVSMTTFAAFGMAGDPFSLHHLFGSLLFGALAAYEDYRRVKAGRRNALESCLLDIGALRGVGLPNIARAVDEFIND